MKDAKSMRLGRPPKGAEARKHTRSATFSEAELDEIVTRSEIEKRPIADYLRDGALGLVRGDVGAGTTRRSA